MISSPVTLRDVTSHTCAWRTMATIIKKTAIANPLMPPSKLLIRHVREFIVSWSGWWLRWSTGMAPTKYSAPARGRSCPPPPNLLLLKRCLLPFDHICYYYKLSSPLLNIAPRGPHFHGLVPAYFLTQDDTPPPFRLPHLPSLFSFPPVQISVDRMKL